MAHAGAVRTAELPAMTGTQVEKGRGGGGGRGRLGGEAGPGEGLWRSCRRSEVIWPCRRHWGLLQRFRRPGDERAHETAVLLA